MNPQSPNGEAGRTFAAAPWLDRVLRNPLKKENESACFMLMQETWPQLSSRDDRPPETTAISNPE